MKHEKQVLDLLIKKRLFRMDEKLKKIIFDQLDNLNKNRPKKFKNRKKINTHLTGSKTDLDSVELIGFLVSLEEKINVSFKKKIKIIDEKISGNLESIATIDKLFKILKRKLKKKNDYFYNRNFFRIRKLFS